MFIDTNYFLRFLLRDVEHQYEEVKELFLASAEGKIHLITSTIVFFEIYWVLFSFYKKTKNEFIDALQKILNLQFIELEEREILFDSLILFQKTNLDLEDCYNLCYAKAQKVESFKTFDRKLEKEFSK